MSRVSSSAGGFDLRMRARISSRAEFASGIRFPLPVAPPLPEALLGDGAQIARRGPSSEHSRQFGDHALMHKGPLSDAGHALRRLQPLGIAEDVSHCLHPDIFGIQLAAQALPLFTNDFAAKVNEHLGNIDLHRANLVARAAQRRGVGQGLRVLHGLELRGEDSSNGALIYRSISMASGLPIHRASVQTGSAADAMQSLAPDGVGVNFGASVIEQDNVYRLRSVSCRNARPDRGIGIHTLARRRTREGLQEYLQVLERRH